MGMDVIGMNPKSEAGEYFRNNIWWWRRLAEYCLSQYPEIIKDDNDGWFTNSGYGLNATRSRKLGEALLEDLRKGVVQKAEKRYNEYIATLPASDCTLCDGSGIRSDEVGVSQQMPEKELDPNEVLALGRTHGWCNGCRGTGKVDHPETNYPFSAENVAEFARFLVECGGFRIY